MKEKQEIIWEANPKNQGFQELVIKSEKINIIVRNQRRQSSEIKKYKITIEEL